MSIKIENKLPAGHKGGRRSDMWQEFLAIVPKLKVGQSFVLPAKGSNYRLAASVARVWLGFKLVISEEGEGIRVGRTD